MDIKSHGLQLKDNIKLIKDENATNEDDIELSN